MADIFGMSDSTGLTESGAAVAGSTLSTGDLRRKYNFGDRVSELAIAQDPFFRFLSKVSKKPTDDHQFKFTERRPSYHKRYAYVTAHGTSRAGMVTNQATATAGNLDPGDTYYFQFMTDYKNNGNIGQVRGSATSIQVGDDGTQPKFIIPGQLIKVPFQATGATTDLTVATTVKDYIVVRVEEVTSTSTGSRAANKNAVDCKVVVVKDLDSDSNIEIGGWGAGGTADESLAGTNTSDSEFAALTMTQLEGARSHVVGNSFGQGSGYPETWKDNPFSTGFGLTQIFKTSLAMDNTTRATVTKYEPNEYARVWREKLIEHKWDIETALLFGSQYTDGNGVTHTQGALDYIISYGNVFDGSGMGGSGTKSQDDFLDDMSHFLDPRYNNANATLFFVSTDVYNWMHKLSGYMSANINQVNNISSNTNGQANWDMGRIGSKDAFGVSVTTFSTPYGDINVARNVHLDGSPVKMIGVNMRYCSYRPLVGNGLNRDTAIYVGVQTLENSGVDRRVDLIQTEAGMEWQMPESHAVWK
jgi:hypothetical protein|tara:strand:- start:120 stop:1706 length:1587 start_codon:yes stop_codon:yes gene_type:complete